MEGVGWAVPAPSSSWLPHWCPLLVWNPSLLVSGAQREAFLHASLLTSFFVLSTVCFLPPDLMCVSFLVTVLTSVSVLFVSLTAETVSQEGHPKQSGRVLQE